MITTLQSPNSFFSPVYNDMLYEVESDNVAQPNFNFICDIYVRGATPYVHRMKVKPEPVNNHGLFFINGILENFILTHYPDPNSTDAFFDCTESYASYELKFGEEYGPDGSIVTYPDLSSEIGYCYNGALAFNDDGVTGSTFTLATITSQALTMRKVYSLYRSQYDFLYYQCQISPAIEKMMVRTFDGAGAVIATHEFTNPSPGVAGMFMMPAGYNLNNISPTYHTAGGSPVIDDAVKFMRIWFVDTGGARRSIFYNVFISDECNGYDEYDLWWLNRAGGRDSYRFRKVTDKLLDPIVRQQYKKTPYTAIPGGLYTLDNPARAMSNYFTSSQDTWILRTDWMNQEEVARIRDLYDASVATLWDGGRMKEVNLVAGSFKAEPDKTGQLIRYEVQVKFANLNYRQRS